MSSETELKQKHNKIKEKEMTDAMMFPDNRNSVIHYRGTFVSLKDAKEQCVNLKIGDAVNIPKNTDSFLQEGGLYTWDGEDWSFRQESGLYVWNGEGWSEYPQYQKSNIDIEDIVTDIIVCPVVVSYSENISVDDAVEKAILVTKHTIIDMIRSTFDEN